MNNVISLDTYRNTREIKNVENKPHELESSHLVLLGLGICNMVSVSIFLFFMYKVILLVGSWR